MSGGYIRLSTTSDLEARLAAYVGPDSQPFGGKCPCAWLSERRLRPGTRLTEGAEDRLGSFATELAGPCRPLNVRFAPKATAKSSASTAAKPEQLSSRQLLLPYRARAGNCHYACPVGRLNRLLLRASGNDFGPSPLETDMASRSGFSRGNASPAEGVEVCSGFGAWGCLWFSRTPRPPVWLTVPTIACPPG